MSCRCLVPFSVSHFLLLTSDSPYKLLSLNRPAYSPEKVQFPPRQRCFYDSHIVSDEAVRDFWRLSTPADCLGLGPVGLCISPRMKIPQPLLGNLCFTILPLKTFSSCLKEFPVFQFVLCVSSTVTGYNSLLPSIRYFYTLIKSLCHKSHLSKRNITTLGTTENQI